MPETNGQCQMGQLLVRAPEGSGRVDYGSIPTPCQRSAGACESRIPGTFGAWAAPPDPRGSLGSPGARFRRPWSVAVRGVPDLFKHLFGKIGVRSLQRSAETERWMHPPVPIPPPGYTSRALGETAAGTTQATRWDFKKRARAGRGQCRFLPALAATAVGAGGTCPCLQFQFQSFGGVRVRFSPLGGAVKTTGEPLDQRPGNTCPCNGLTRDGQVNASPWMATVHAEREVRRAHVDASNGRSVAACCSALPRACSLRTLDPARVSQMAIGFPKCRLSPC
eukprot:gene383-biopygen3107